MNPVLNSRRKFLGSLAATASIAGISGPAAAGVRIPGLKKEADAWFEGIKGDHRVVYDAPEPHDAFPVIWSWAFYYTNNETGTSDDEMTSMVVLRHNAIPYAMKDELWQKYHFGEMFGITDNNTGNHALRNPVYEPMGKDMPMDFIEGIKQQQQRGAMFCVCDLALTVYSGAAANQMGLDPTAVKQEWVDGVLPGIHIVPSGVWALGRAHEHNCAYIYAGG